MGEVGGGGGGAVRFRFIFKVYSKIRFVRVFVRHKCWWLGRAYWLWGFVCGWVMVCGVISVRGGSTMAGEGGFGGRGVPVSCEVLQINFKRSLKS